MINFNFYRIHLSLFVVVPLLFSVILWASAGKFKIRFIDSLFICVSAATGTGLVTYDLSALTAWQQVILVILELIGNQAFVTWIVVFVRRWYFRGHLKYIVDAELARTWTRRSSVRASSLQEIRGTILLRKTGHKTHKDRNGGQMRTNGLGRESLGRIRPEMVRRTDIAPHLVNPAGFQSERPVRIETPDSPNQRAPPDIVEEERGARTSGDLTPREFPSVPHEEVGFGGFPYPQQLLSRFVGNALPGFRRRLQRTITMPRAETLIPNHEPPAQQERTAFPRKRVPYISFTANVGNNSAFQGLTPEELEELGGVEYRSLSALLWIVPLYYIGILAAAIIIITPYMTLPRWRNIFLPPEQHRKISPVWFSVFQIVGAWANTGMSLVDQNMQPFQKAYLMIIVLIFLVLAGNTAFPILFRFLIWILWKIFPAQSRTKESLHFLLDHPRRCLLTVFPSRQTRVLLAILLLMNLILWLGYLVLDIGNPLTEAIPVGDRIIIGFLEAAAVRSAGYQTVPISGLFPAVQVLYVVMMYIAIYPIALSVRATNVYEEKSLGIYDPVQDEDEKSFVGMNNRIAIWGKHLVRHARRQLAFDMWWLAFSLFLLCIIERRGLTNAANSTWFNVFALIFELVSAYGTVGLSLGIPGANYSLSGAFHTLSKLILCAVMLRGRHRGLPDALDRAVLLPHEFRKKQKNAGQSRTSVVSTGRMSPNQQEGLQHMTQGTSMIPLERMPRRSQEEQRQREETEEHGQDA